VDINLRWSRRGALQYWLPVALSGHATAQDRLGKSQMALDPCVRLCDNNRY